MQLDAHLRGHRGVTYPDLATAWDELHTATPPGWQVGRPYFHDETDWWEQYAWLPRGGGERGYEKDWIAVGRTEVECVHEMARCLVELGEGRWPR